MNSDSSANTNEPDWAKQIVDTLDSVIGAVRSKTSDKAVGIVKVIVYALLAAGIGTSVMLLITIGFVRVVDILLPGAVWSAYLLLGGIFFVVGALFWSRRSKSR